MGDNSAFGFDPDDFDRVIREGSEGVRDVFERIGRFLGAPGVADGMVGGFRRSVAALAARAGDRRRGRRWRVGDLHRRRPTATPASSRSTRPNSTPCGRTKRTPTPSARCVFCPTASRSACWTTPRRSRRVHINRVSGGFSLTSCDGNVVRVPCMWHRAAPRARVLRCVRHTAHADCRAGRVQAGDGPLRRRRAVDGHRGGLGPERLREVMTELVDRSATVVQRYGGTVDKFTGDGFMALFGAPITLEDHAFRACLAALDIQQMVRQLAVEVDRRDGIEFRLRIGLNSGQVIAGEVGANHLGYTAIGEQVGMAQRMESVAPPGGVMLSALTARLVEDRVVLGERETVCIKGFDTGVPARRLLDADIDRRRKPRHESRLVGRRSEKTAVTELLDQVERGAGSIVTVTGRPGVGKDQVGSRIDSDGEEPRLPGGRHLLRIPHPADPVPRRLPAAACGLRHRRNPGRGSPGAGAQPDPGSRPPSQRRGPPAAR